MTNSQVIIMNADDSASRTGIAFWVGQVASASFVPIFGDATAAGTVKIQCNNDVPVGTPSQYTPGSTFWADVPNATSTITSGAGSAIVIGNMCFAYIRAVFTHSGGGTTTVQVNMNTLGV